MPDIPFVTLPSPGEVGSFLVNPFGVYSESAAEISDSAVKDKRVMISKVLADTGWGPANSDLNKRARTVVRRESNGNVKAYNRSGATGWFQMMTPLHCGNYGIPGSNTGRPGGKESEACRKWLENPYNNSRAAKALYDANGWTPWAASGGAPQPTSWDMSVRLEKNTLGTVVEDVVDTVTDPIGGLVEMVSVLFQADTWARIGKGALGGMLLVMGTGAMVFVIANKASKTPVGKAGAGIAKKVVTKGVVK